MDTTFDRRDHIALHGLGRGEVGQDVGRHSIKCVSDGLEDLALRSL
jgi:hypothetical protein